MQLTRDSRKKRIEGLTQFGEVGAPARKVGEVAQHPYWIQIHIQLGQLIVLFAAHEKLAIQFSVLSNGKEYRIAGLNPLIDGRKLGDAVLILAVAQQHDDMARVRRRIHYLNSF